MQTSICRVSHNPTNGIDTILNTAYSSTHGCDFADTASRAVKSAGEIKMDHQEFVKKYDESAKIFKKQQKLYNQIRNLAWAQAKAPSADRQSRIDAMASEYRQLDIDIHELFLGEKKMNHGSVI